MSATVAKLTPSSLAALLCARICHDLISPVGALSTAIEILDDDSNTDMHSDAMDLIRNSSRQANAKLKFLRLALGAGGSAPGIIAIHEIKALVEGMYGEAKANLIWNTAGNGIDKNGARILLNLVMLAVQAVPRGGDITLNVTQDASALTLVLDATGPKSRLDAAIEKTLSGKTPEDGFDGRTVQPFYTGMLIRESKGSASAAIEGETVTFRANLPTNPV